MARFSSVLALMLVVPLLLSLALARSPASSSKILSPTGSPSLAAAPKASSLSSPPELAEEGPAMSPSSISSATPSEAPVPAVSSADLNRLGIAGSVAVVAMAVAWVM